jgi:glucans biosynthesis protein
MDVQAILYPRSKIKKLGLAPLNSMYLYGAGRSRPDGYLYPAVHDSDGLLLETRDGHWIWRPLSDPKALGISGFYIDNPLGFGLMQRDRHSRDYPSIPSPYSQRPSAWVAPDSEWGKGHVELVEIPSPNENNDNIVAYWVPDEPPPAHEPFKLSYSIYWQGSEPPRSPVGRVVSTHFSVAKKHHNTRMFAIDFAGGALDELNKEDHPDTVIQVAKNGKIKDSSLVMDEATGTWRLTFSVDDTNGKSVQLRAYLARNGKPLTETWDYVMPGS